MKKFAIFLFAIFLLMSGCSNQTGFISETEFVSEAEKSTLGLYQFALDVAAMQEDLKSRLTANNSVKKVDLIANPDLFSELGSSDKAKMIQYVEEKTGRKIVLKTREECVSEGIADYSRMNAFGFIDAKYAEFSMKGYFTDQSTCQFTISFYTGPMASIACSFTAKRIDNTWQIEDKFSIMIS